MRDTEKTCYIMWALTVVALFGWIFYLTGCSGSQSEQKAELVVDYSFCHDRALAIAWSTDTCEQALGALQRLFIRVPECRAIIGDASTPDKMIVGGVTLSCDFGDGGIRGH